MTTRKVRTTAIPAPLRRTGRRQSAWADMLDRASNLMDGFSMSYVAEPGGPALRSCYVSLLRARKLRGYKVRVELRGQAIFLTPILVSPGK